MLFEQKCSVSAPREVVWNFLMDVPRVAECVSGVRNVQRIDGDRYKGDMGVNVGPIRLTLEGNITLEQQDKENWKAVMKAEAAEKRVGGGLQATMNMVLTEPAPGQTELVITTNANLLGRLGEFGQWVIRKKADSMLQEFARNLQAKLEQAQFP